MTTLIYSVFVIAWLFRKPLSNLYDRCPGPHVVKVAALFLASGCLTETLAWLNNYLSAATDPALFHPQLFADLIIGIGFYGGWAVAWLIALIWFRYSAKEAFFVTGIQGIFFEQLGAVFLAMLSLFRSNPATALLFGVYVFLVHGSAVGLAMCFQEKDAHNDQRSGHWIRFPVVVVLMVAGAFAGCAIVDFVAELFGGLPEKRSIIDHPFW